MKFFKPVIQLMNSMKYTYKFLLIGVIFIITIAVISTFVLKNNKEDIDLIEQRNAGAQYSLIMKDLLKYTQQHRGTSVSAFGGDSEAQKSLQTIEQNMHEVFEELNTYENELTYDFGTLASTKSLREQWEAIVSTTKWDSTTSIVEKHTNMTTLIMQTMLDISNESQLIIGQSAESSNLVYSLVKTMPALTENLGLVRATSMGILKAGELTADQQHALDEKYYVIERNLEMINEDMAVVYMNENMKTAIEPIHSVANDSAQQYLTNIENLIIKHDFTIDSAEFYSVATEAINAQFDMYDEALTYLTTLILSQADDLKAERTMIFIIEGIVLLVLLYLFIGFYLGIKQSISRMQQVTEQVAEGNLTAVASFETNDEMKDIEVAMNQMISSLNTIVGQISVSAEYVAASSEELHASVEETTKSITHVSETVEVMASGAERQTVTIGQNTAELNNMADSVDEMVTSTDTILSLSKNTMLAAKDGNSAMQDSSKQMEAIQQSVEQTSDTIAVLNTRSVQIGEILNLITGIAEQTNLLALNASIEAARAGEHGKGFAVVANEVGNLAAQSKQSAKQVTELVQSIQSDTKQSVQLMEKVQANVVTGLQISENTATKFEEILQSMTDLELQIEQVTARSTRLASDTAEIVHSMEDVMEVSKETATISEEIASATEEQHASMEEISSSAIELSKMAEELQKTVHSFTIK